MLKYCGYHRCQGLETNVTTETMEKVLDNATGEQQNMLKLRSRSLNHGANSYCYIGCTELQKCDQALLY